MLGSLLGGLGHPGRGCRQGRTDDSGRGQTGGSDVCGLLTCHLSPGHALSLHSPPPFENPYG